jgi:hypothetical protein
VSRGSKSKAALSEKDLTRWKLIADFQQRLGCARQGSTLPATQSDPRRLLSETDYLSLLLFGLFNPVVESMRGLCAAIHHAALLHYGCRFGESSQTFAIFSQIARRDTHFPSSPHPQLPAERSIHLLGMA